MPRASHAGWKPKKGRRDPVELLIESNAGRVENLIPIRHARMRLRSPYTRAKWIALLPLMNPTTCDTEYFGGIDNIM